MKRRGFLGLLALVPAIPSLVREAIAAPVTPPKQDAIQMSWYELERDPNAQWRHVRIERKPEMQEVWVDGKLVYQGSNVDCPYVPGAGSDIIVDDFRLTFKSPTNPMEWPTRSS